MSQPSIAIIGSFRKHLEEMQSATNVFTEHGIEVVNPLSTEPIEAGIDFVRFATDDESLSDGEVQLEALKRILAATAVYVMCPGGYVGRTTSFEWGWVEGRRRPAYFSEFPDEWFMQQHAEGRVVTPLELSRRVLALEVKPLEIVTGASESDRTIQDVPLE